MSRETRSVVGRVARDAGSPVVGARALRVVLSTGEEALDGHTVDPNGWTWPRSGRVPLLDCHNSDALRAVLGHVDDFKITRAPLQSGREAPALLGTMRFAEQSANPDADVAWELYRAGHCDAVSVSWVPLEYEMSTDRNRRPGSMDFKRQQLLEVSCTPIPADENARVLARSVRARLAPNGLNAQDLHIYGRYEILRSGYGYDIDMAARYLLVDARRLRLIVARMLQADVA